MGTSLEELLDQMESLVIQYTKQATVSSEEQNTGVLAAIVAQHSLIDRMKELLKKGKITSLHRVSETFGFKQESAE